MRVGRCRPRRSRSLLPLVASPTSPATSRPPPPRRGTATDVDGTARQRRRNPFRRLDVRLVLGMLAVALPVMLGLTALLVTTSSTSLASAAGPPAAGTW